MHEPLLRLLAAARNLIHCDSAVVLRSDGDALAPIAAHGLRDEALARRYAIAMHPRLARVMEARGPVRFDDSPLPDPFDGLFASAGDERSRAHACIGCPLIVDDQAVGALVLDALDPHAFDNLDAGMVAALAAMACAVVRTAALEEAATLPTRAPQQLVREALDRMGGELLGTSPSIAGLRREIEVLARTHLNALITGETGVGKELVAHAIHAKSSRAKKPMVHVNCAALPESLAESELFGHVRGAFTGASDHRAGKFEIADGGTLFLDEIGELPPAIQPKLLRVLQSGEVQRIGADQPIRVDVRVIAATNRRLADEVREGRFRADLCHRLSVFPVEVPPLREHREDIPVLSGHFLELASERLQLGPIRLATAARKQLREHDWPGNVRELEHTLLRATVRASTRPHDETLVIEAADLGLAPTTLQRPRTALPLRDAVDGFTRELIQETVVECDGNWAEAARRLGLQRGNLHRLASRLQLPRT
jgi:anaerobic nitric oxide reductase transcription regulator